MTSRNLMGTSVTHNKSSVIRLRSLALLLATAIFSPAVFALPDELQVHLDETNKPGQFSLDTVVNYALSKPAKSEGAGLRSSAHLLQISPELGYGITKNTQVSLQIFSSIDANRQLRVDGARAGLTTMFIRPDDEDDDGLFFGTLMEAGRLPATLSVNRIDGEIKFLMGYRSGRWLFAFNPEIGFKIAGSGPSEPELSIKAKIAYRSSEGYRFGIEHFGEFGQLGHLGPLNQQSQQTFAVIDFKSQHVDVGVGVGRGWNAYSQRWLVKTTISFPISN